jgi:hypothetical protein
MEPRKIPAAIHAVNILPVSHSLVAFLQSEI